MIVRQNEPLTALWDDDAVLIDGPGYGIASLSPDAAEETGRRIIAAAQQARHRSAASTPSPACIAADAAESVQNP